MPKVNVLPFRWYHLIAMDLRDAEREYLSLFPDYYALAKAQQDKGPCFTAFVEDEGPACSWGFVPLWDGVFECWMLTGRLIEKYPTKLIRAAQRVIDNVEIELQSHRLQMVVNASHPKSLRFAEALSFLPEGVLKAYGPNGADFVMLSRVNYGRNVQEAKDAG